MEHGDKYETNDFCVATYKLIYGDNIAYLSFSIHSDNPLITKHTKYYRNAYCTVQYLFTDLQHRNKGYATKLLLHLIELSEQSHRLIHCIKLDDCSDNFNKCNNLYLNCGFEYINHGEPEMIYRF